MSHSAERVQVIIYQKTVMTCLILITYDGTSSLWRLLNQRPRHNWGQFNWKCNINLHTHHGAGTNRAPKPPDIYTTVFAFSQSSFQRLIPRQHDTVLAASSAQKVPRADSDPIWWPNSPVKSHFLVARGSLDMHELDDPAAMVTFRPIRGYDWSHIWEYAWLLSLNMS